MNAEQEKLRAKLDRELMTVDQKIDALDAKIIDANDKRADLLHTREAILAAAVVLRNYGGQL